MHIVSGYHLGVLNTSLGAVAADLGFSEAGAGAVVTSALVLGACFGSLGAGAAADSLGPKRALILNTLPLLVGGAVCAAAASLWGMLAGRLVAGLGAGAASVLTPRCGGSPAAPPVRRPGACLQCTHSCHEMNTELSLPPSFPTTPPQIRG